MIKSNVNSLYDKTTMNPENFDNLLKEPSNIVLDRVKLSQEGRTYLSNHFKVWFGCEDMYPKIRKSEEKAFLRLVRADEYKTLNRYNNCSWESVLTNNTDGYIIEAANYTQTNCFINYTGGATAAGRYNNTLWRINSTTTYCSAEEQETQAMEDNLTAGVDNISEKIPTILLIMAVIVLLGALAILIRNSGELGVGGASGSL